jgi:hypothetical protein
MELAKDIILWASQAFQSNPIQYKLAQQNHLFQYKKRLWKISLWKRFKIYKYNTIGMGKIHMMNLKGDNLSM